MKTMRVRTLILLIMLIFCAAGLPQSAAAVTVTDIVPPVDGILTATSGDGLVSLSWTAATDNVAVANYKLVSATDTIPGDCSGTTAKIINGTDTTYTDTSLINGITINYRLCAVDTSGSVSPGVTASATPLAVSGALQLIDTSPLPDAIMEDVTVATVSAGFNMALNPASVNSATFFVNNATGAPVAGAISLSTDKNALTFTPTSFFAADTTYTATITSGVQSSSGTPASDHSWNFRMNPYLGGVAAEGNLLVTPMMDGSIGVYRYIAGSWQQQIFNWFDKGSRLQVGGVAYQNGGIAYNLMYVGYTDNGIVPKLAANSQVSATMTKSQWTTDSGLRITQQLTYQPGAAYYGLTWNITNESTVALADLRFFHGEDTYFSGIDSGGGFWDAPNSTIGVQRTYNQTTQSDVRRMSLQAITPPYAYDSKDYYEVYQNGLNGALTNYIDPSELTDNGYALEWRTPTLAAGASWNITAFEKFADVPVGAVTVTAPVITSCEAGKACTLTYTITNISGTDIQNLNLSLVADQKNWSATTGSSSLSVPAGASQPVVVTLTIPVAGASAGLIGHLTLSANDGVAIAKDTAAVYVTIPVLTSQSISFGTAPELIYGGPHATISASASSNLAVSFSSLTSTVCSVSASSITPLMAGTCTIAADQAGNSSYSAAPQATLSMTIAKAIPVISWSNPADVAAGTPLSATQLNATATMAGTLSYIPAAGSILSAGNGQTLTATFTPSDTANYTTATKSVTINVTATVAPTIPDGIMLPAPGKTAPALADALRALHISMDDETANANDLQHGDVAPLVNGVPKPDGVIDVGDVVVLLRRVLGLVIW